MAPASHLGDRGGRTQSPAHCATLTARILRKAIGACLRHPSAWYGPSILYAELSQDLRDQQISPETTLITEETTATVETMLHSRDDEVQVLDDVKCLDGGVRRQQLPEAHITPAGDRPLSVERLAHARKGWPFSLVHRTSAKRLHSTVERQLFTGLVCSPEDRKPYADHAGSHAGFFPPHDLLE